jgi:ribosomal protein L7/L12
MKLEFRNIRLELTDAELSRGVSVTVGGETIVLGLPQEAPVPVPASARSEFVDDQRGTMAGVNHYAMSFHRVWTGGTIDKINSIKCVRAHLGLGLGDAKALVEGAQTVYIRGPRWDLSHFRRDLMKCINVGDARLHHIDANVSDACPYT